MEVAKKVCQEMLQQRNWIISVVEETQIKGITNDGKTYEIYFVLEPKLNISNVKACIETTGQKIDHRIIVYNKNITPSAKKVINNYVESTFELFTLNDLQFNITKHYLVPEHTMLSNEEAEQFKKSLGIDIPILQKTDKVCQFYNFPRGAIIKITRRDGGVGYRIVK